ncbi:MAG: hypothetical protein JWM00_249 [Candidatus Saccharibacteria bacterium]|nr:hypothetical protein [Candidatus Saccharibacteria bacterium]
MKKRTRTGFTIVELLIVVVVIGILASISVVAYNGFQQRARDAKRISDVENIAESLSLWASVKNHLFSASGAGRLGTTVGFINTVNPPTANYSATSIKSLLIQQTDLNSDIQESTYQYEVRDYVVTLCQDTDTIAATEKNRRVVMTRLDVAPSKTIAQQLPECGGSGNDTWFTAWQTSSGMNYAKMAEGNPVGT